jgi:hypothetical protein
MWPTINRACHWTSRAYGEAGHQQVGASLQYLSSSSAIDAACHGARNLATLAAAILFFLLFIYIELRIAHKPIMPLALLQRRTTLCIGLIAGLVAIVNFNMVYHLGMLFEIVFQQPVSQAGAHLLPNSVSHTTLLWHDRSIDLIVLFCRLDLLGRCGSLDWLFDQAHKPLQMDHKHLLLGTRVVYGIASKDDSSNTRVASMDW